MKIKISLYFLSLTFMALCLVACRSSHTERPITTTPAPCVLAPDRYGKATMKVDVTIPSGFMTKRMRLCITPQLMTGERILETYSPILLEGSIYKKKQERNETFGHYDKKDFSHSAVINVSKPYTFQIDQAVILPKDVQTARVVGIVTSDGCGRCETYGELDLARLSSPLTLLPELKLQTMWDETQKTVAPKIFNGKEEARLQFEINKSDINLALGSNRSELERVKSKLTPVIKDPYSTLNSLSITGMASADGPLKFNTKLSRDRAQSASDWLESVITFPAKAARKIRVSSRPEGWAPVLDAMEADNHPDASKVARILEKYGDKDDDVAEKYIRELKCWNDIAANYLAKDRKVEFEYTYTVKSFTTDKELQEMYARRPDLFSEAEFMKIASMYADKPDSLMDVYTTALKYYPKSEVIANNLAVLKINRGAYREAKKILSGIEISNPVVLNNLAIAEAGLGSTDEAETILETLPGDISRHNLGLLYASDHDADQAWTLLEPYDDLNTAIVALAVNENLQAAHIMEAIADVSPLAEYVRAMIAARLGDSDGFLSHLSNAVRDENLKKRALSEPDFLKYHEDKRFIEITGAE